MTLAELCRIVCTCIGRGGITPPDWPEGCEETRMGDLGLSEEDILGIIGCIVGELRDRGCEAYIGPAQFPADATVRQACRAIAERTTCD